MKELLLQAIENLDDAIDQIEGNLSDSEDYKILSDMINELEYMIEEMD